jgi:hypothetical protein
MSTQEVRSGSSAGGQERMRLLVLGALILGGVGVYLAFGRGANTADRPANLLPYQGLVRTLPESEQAMYRSIRDALPTLESERAQSRRWPTVTGLAGMGIAPFANSASYTWHQAQRGATVNYLGIPTDPAQPAWLLTIQEPEPNQPPDPAPLDDEHHRLPDGTTLHIYVWSHRFGGRVTPRFTPQPQSEGWTELFATPPNPVVPPRS